MDLCESQQSNRDIVIILLSPSKRLAAEATESAGALTLPEYLSEAGQLIARLRKLSKPQLRTLLAVSERLAQEASDDLNAWQTPFTAKNSGCALLSFRGDVYDGLSAEDFDKHDREFAQKHLRILSGLYGILRPLDRMQRYRLEMGCRFSAPASGKNRGFKNLYDFWGALIRENITALAAEKNQPIINLASLEYFKVLQPNKLKVRVVTPIFKQKKGGTYKVVSFFAKKARGQMTGYLIRSRLSQPEQMCGFKEDGYRFNKPLSSQDELVFTRA